MSLSTSSLIGVGGAKYLMLPRSHPPSNLCFANMRCFRTRRSWMKEALIAIVYSPWTWNITVAHMRTVTALVTPGALVLHKGLVWDPVTQKNLNHLVGCCLSGLSLLPQQLCVNNSPWTCRVRFLPQSKLFVVRPSKPTQEIEGLLHEWFLHT